MSITLNFKGPGGKEFSVSANEEMTVLELKEKCIEHVDIPVEAQRLIYKGKILKDKEKLSFYNVQDGHTLHLVKSGITPKEVETQRAAETEKPSTMETEQASSSAANIPTGNNGRVELNQSPGDLSNPNFADLINNFSSAMNNNQNNDTRDMFANMLNNPLARSLMNEISNNPEMISNLLSNTDILRGAMPDNPYINQFLQNPNLLRETFSPEMVRATLNSFENGNGMNYGNMDMGMFSSRMEEMLSRLGDPNARGATNPNNPTSTATTGNGTEGNAGTDNINMSMNNLMQSSMFQSFLNNMRNDPNFANMNFDGMNANWGMNNPNVNTNDTRPLEEVYASQLKSLQEMGFIDVAANLQALQETGGDINATVTRLLERGFN